MPISPCKVFDKILVLKSKIGLMQEEIDRIQQKGINTNLLDLLDILSSLDDISGILHYFTYLKPEEYVKGKASKLRVRNEYLEYLLDQSLKRINVPNITARIISSQREEIEELQSKIRKMEECYDKINNRTAV